MSLQTVATRFVELCNQFRNFDVMETMYSPDIVSVEASGAQTSGKEAVIQKSRDWGAGREVHSEKVEGPFYNDTHRFAVTFTFEVTPKDTGVRQIQHEVGVYTINNQDQIIREEFFYQGTW